MVGKGGGVAVIYVAAYNITKANKRIGGGKKNERINVLIVCDRPLLIHNQKLDKCIFKLVCCTIQFRNINQLTPKNKNIRARQSFKNIVVNIFNQTC